MGNVRKDELEVGDNTNCCVPLKVRQFIFWLAEREQLTSMVILEQTR